MLNYLVCQTACDKCKNNAFTTDNVTIVATGAANVQHVQKVLFAMNRVRTTYVAEERLCLKVQKQQISLVSG